MTTLIGWYDKQGTADASYLIADGRISDPKSSDIYCDSYPKVIPIDVTHYRQTTTGIEQGPRFSIGVAFAGSTLMASATVESFRQVCSTLASTEGRSPSLLHLGNLLADVHQHHLSSYIYPENCHSAYLLTGHCPVDQQTQIIVLKDEGHSGKLTSQVLPMGTEPIILGSDKAAVEDVIGLENKDITMPLSMKYMSTLHKICISGGVGRTGGTFSLGYFNPVWKQFQTRYICDYELDAEGSLVPISTINGYDVSKIKEILPGFYCSAFGFSPFDFAERITKLTKHT